MLIKVTTQTIHLDPGLLIYEIELERDEKIWRETFGSRQEVDRFLRGVEAGYNLTSSGFLNLPFITSHSDETTESFTKDPE